MAVINFLEKYHKRTERDYIGRVTGADKAMCSEKAIQYDYDYWDGDRKYGYGGYHYDGRWKTLAQDFIEHYQLKDGMKVLDVGCGKGFQLYELKQLLPGLEIYGADISQYAIDHSKEEINDSLILANATSLPFEDGFFDFAFSLTTFHNFYNYELDQAIKEIQRVCPSAKKFISIESYRNEKEKANLLYWQLTCRAFHTPEEWQWLLDQAGYVGDLGFIFFE